MELLYDNLCFQFKCNQHIKTGIHFYNIKCFCLLTEGWITLKFMLPKMLSFNFSIHLRCSSFLQSYFFYGNILWPLLFIKRLIELSVVKIFSQICSFCTKLSWNKFNYKHISCWNWSCLHFYFVFPKHSQTKSPTDITKNPSLTQILLSFIFNRPWGPQKLSLYPRERAGPRNYVMLVSTPALGSTSPDWVLPKTTTDGYAWKMLSFKDINRP